MGNVYPIACEKIKLSCSKNKVFVGDENNNYYLYDLILIYLFLMSLSKRLVTCLLFYCKKMIPQDRLFTLTCPAM